MRAAKGSKGIAVAILALTFSFWIRIALAQGEEQGFSAAEARSQPSEEELGVGNFSKFPFHVTASVRGGYDDNVSTTGSNPQESWFTNGAVAINYDFGDPRTQLSLQTGGGATYYWDRIQSTGFDNQDYDINSYIGLTLRHKVSPRLTLDVTTYATYQTEPDFALAVGLNRRSGNFFYTQDKFAATYLWTPRFSTTTSYTFGAVHYDDFDVGLFEDRWENTFGNEFKFLVWPTTSLVAEYRFELVNYMHEDDPIGPTLLLRNGTLVTPLLDRDSMTHFILGGIDHTFNPRLSASFRGGAEFRDYSDATTDEHRIAPYFEATVNYAVAKTTSVSWNTRYAIEEGDVLLNPTRKTFRTGLRASQDLTPRLSATVAAYYENDDYESLDTATTVSPAFNEEALDLAVSLRLAITHYFGVEAGYNHTEVWSDVSVFEYSRNRYWAGVNLLF